MSVARACPLVLVAGVVLLGTAAPAYATDEIKATVNPAAVNIAVGGPAASAAITLTNSFPAAGTGSLTFTLPPELSTLGVHFAAADTGCQVTAAAVSCPAVPVPASGSVTVTVAVQSAATSTLPSGQNVTGQVNVDGTFLTVAGVSTVSPDFAVVLAGPTPSGVPKIAGKVVDGEGKPVPAAVVTITDAKGKSRGVTANDQGQFSYVAASPAEEFSPGPLTIVATKAGFNPTTTTRTGVAGDEITDAEIAMTPVVAPPTVQQRLDPAPAAKDEGLTGAVWAMLIAGVLLLAGGAVTIFLILRKGREPRVPTPTVYRSGAHTAPDEAKTQIFPVYRPEPRPGDAPTVQVPPPAKPPLDQPTSRLPTAPEQPAKPAREPKLWDWLDD